MDPLKYPLCMSLLEVDMYPQEDHFFEGVLECARTGVPYSEKFSQDKIFVVFADLLQTTQI